MHDIAQKEPNELGIYDMSGNYAELTFGVNIYDVDGNYYGGCWNDPDYDCTSSSYEIGKKSGDLYGSNGNKLNEKNAFNGKYITVRLMYPKQ